MIRLAMIDLMSRRLTREATLNRRGTQLARTGLNDEVSALVKAAVGSRSISGVGELRKVHVGDAEVG